jgi:serine/threonine protein kinase
MSKKPEKRQPATVYVYHLEKDKRSWWICSKSIDKSSKISDRKITNFLKKTTKDKNAKKGSYKFKPRVLDEIKNTLKNNELYQKHSKSIDILMIDKKIGAGGSGTIWLGKWQRQKIAYKILNEANISGANMDDFIQELSLLLKLQHPNIIKFYGITIKQNRIGIVMEYLPNSLMQLIKDKKVVIDEEEIKLTWLIKLEIIRGLTLALKYMHHNKDIAHRDVKPDNVLLKKGKNNLLVPIIIDFGLSKQIRNKEGTTLAIGTGFYMAPELTVVREKNGKEIKEIDVKKTDVFSAFMTIIELVNEEPLYRDYRDRGVNGYAIASSIQMKALAPEKIKGNKCPKEFLEYINNNIFPREPNNRPAMAEFSEWLEDNKKILEGFNKPETKSSKATTKGKITKGKNTKGNIKKHVKLLPKPPVPTEPKEKPNKHGKKPKDQNKPTHLLNKITI